MRLGRHKAALFSVVLADDQPEVRIALRRFLERDGRFEIIAEVEDGQGAVVEAETQRPDALILDMAMPGMDGLVALPAIMRLSPDTKVVVLSSMAPFADTTATALSLGAAAVFDKYTSPKKLTKYLATILTQDARTREISA